MRTGTTTTVLILPGLFNSGKGHWQSLWEAHLPNVHRVRQRDWDNPVRSEWVAALDAVIRQTEGLIVLAAHSLGCALTAWWGAERFDTAHAARVKGALLVAPPDVERTDFPQFASGFAPMPRERLPFASIVAASSDDPWCALQRAKSWAADWGARFHDIGARGHINSESGLNIWPQGQAWVTELAMR
jgi:predicted alpha/beta hydrolase family esterase